MERGRWAAAGQLCGACVPRSVSAVRLSSPVLVPIGDVLSFFAFSLFFPPSSLSLSCFFCNRETITDKTARTTSCKALEAASSLKSQAGNVVSTAARPTVWAGGAAPAPSSGSLPAGADGG